MPAQKYGQGMVMVLPDPGHLENKFASNQRLVNMDCRSLETHLAYKPSGLHKQTMTKAKKILKISNDKTRPKSND